MRTPLKFVALFSAVPALAQLPTLSLPSLTLPSLSLPTLPLPSLSLPSLSLPSLSLPSISLPSSLPSGLPPLTKQFVEASAIVTNANNDSAFECWRLTDPFATSSEAGTAGASSMNIESLANATYTIIPPRFEGGVHNAPHPQIVVFISGVAHVTLPNGTDDAFIVGGSDGIIFAVDAVGTGHNTSYPSNMETRALQIPFANGTIPPHTVVSAGPCQATSQIVTGL